MRAFFALTIAALFAGAFLISVFSPDRLTGGEMRQYLEEQRIRAERDAYEYNMRRAGGTPVPEAGKEGPARIRISGFNMGPYDETRGPVFGGYIRLLTKRELAEGIS